MTSRRKFLKMTALAGTGVALARPFGGTRALAFAQTPTNIRKFAVRLPGLGPSGANEIGQYLPLATKHTIPFAGKSTDLYNLVATEYSQTMHPDLPGKTKFFGYSDLFTLDRKYLGGIIVAKRGTPVMLTMTNLIPPKHILPVDGSIMAGPNQMTMDLPTNRIAVHLHGGLTPWFSDGTPFQWFTPLGKHGPSFMNVPGFPVLPGTGSNYYPNDQSGRMVWYHDHAMGITRLNAYAGLASGYIITDDFEAGLVSKGLLPDLIGIPLVLQDKGFVGNDILTQDPTWNWGGPGSLWYPHDYEVNTFADGTSNPKGRWDWGPTVPPPASQGTQPLPTISAIPEAYFDTPVINGALYPVVSVPPKRVRFRLLNGSQARAYHLNLLPEDRMNPGEPNTSVAGPVMYQIGTEGGLLPKVAIHRNNIPIQLDMNADPSGNTALVNGPFNLLLAGAERADVIIDFNGAAGSSFILMNDAPAPFPGGDSRNNYFTGDADQTSSGGAPTTALGYGPNTQTLLKIMVTSGAGDSLSTTSWLKQMNDQLRGNFASGNQPGLLYNDGTPWGPGKVGYSGPVHRQLTLNEDFDEYGRLIQMLGTFKSTGINNQGMPTWSRGYMSPATETPKAGAVEVWQIMNLTADTHPVHFHLVNVQLIQRQKFASKVDPVNLPGNPDDWDYIADPTGPDENELGWKDTVRMNPGEVTTVIMKFDLPKLPTGEMRNAVSPRTGGKEYVWHCHILEHEEHDMMRPLIVT